MAFRPFRSLTTAALSALALAAACSDPITDPSASLRPDAPRLIVATTSTSAVTLYPTYDNVYQSAEGHRIVIPANSVCQPATSGYGAEFWDKPCTTATAPITFTITTSTNASGYSNVSISPDVRFSPAKQVRVYFRDAAAANTPGLVIKYCNGIRCIDEGETDASQTTYRDPSAGVIHRRLKHFSGYNVVFGRSCDNPDPETGDCPTSDGGGLTSKSPISPVTPSMLSGYITTTARDDR
jgi:hypothetical protein